MSTQCYCDICGEVGRRQRIWIHGWNREVHREFDLCKSCYEAILKKLKVKLV